MIKVMNVVGARPNFMKIAPLIRAMRARPGMAQVLVHTGQHYDENLSRVFFDELDIPRPDYDLGVGSGEREEQIARIRERFAPVVERERPGAVVVVGDVNSTIACAGTAKQMKIPVAHVEAGLRSFDDSMPEEHNRRETDAISDLLFVTEESGMRNLEREDVAGRAYLVGNVMIDTLVASLERAAGSRVLDTLGLSPREYLVATFHRPSNVDEADRLHALIETVRMICERCPTVLPLHPRTEQSLRREGLMERFRALPGLVVCEPLGYLDFLKLVMESRAVVTDSGGIQEETTYLRISCLTMRETTERPATIELGSNVLVGSDRRLLLRELDRILGGDTGPVHVPPLWDGRAAERIVDILHARLSAQ